MLEGKELEAYLPQEGGVWGAPKDTPEGGSVQVSGPEACHMAQEPQRPKALNLG